MSSDSAQQSPLSDFSSTPSSVDEDLQVYLKPEGEKIRLSLPRSTQRSGSTDWSEVWQQLKHRLNGSDRSWQPGTTVHLSAKDRLLDGRQLQAIADALEEVQLQLGRIDTSRRQTAVAAATAGYSVEQHSPIAPLSTSTSEAAPQWSQPLYLQTNVRSGVDVRHSGTVIILGDLNPGGTVIAAGDILIWGRLRGIAHAGAQGNRGCRIMALRMEPTQLRIADAVAKAPETPPAQVDPEVAYIAPQGIRLTKGIDFFKTHSFSAEEGGWTDL
ncbi:MAG: septum site-determining protein MinC [Cyanobacteria bacterium QS_4_48_99]|nr:MAG: septum site-determining protein MinC [Cyanobacteria bacterium QS_4_48_99]